MPQQVSDFLRPTLAGGLTKFAPGVWHDLALTTNGTQVSAVLDGMTLFANQTFTVGSGQVGLVCGTYSYVQFDSFTLHASPAVPARSTLPLPRARSDPPRSPHFARRRRST